jgi:putative hemolysin
MRHGRYELTFVRSAAELDEVLQLRYRVFNLELGEGLESSHDSERDLDEFDAQCHHLIVRDSRRRTIAGTYRMQTAAMAEQGRGFYSADEFDFAGFPHAILDESVELGRACIARDHRNHAVLFLLWRGLAAYLEASGRRYLFGCCSLTSQDPAEGWSLDRKLRQAGQAHPELRLSAREAYSCRGLAGADAARAVHLPRLFRTYLRFGARTCSEPAIDRQFGTIDFLVLFDAESLDSRARKMFF